MQETNKYEHQHITLYYSNYISSPACHSTIKQQSHGSDDTIIQQSSAVALEEIYSLRQHSMSPCVQLMASIFGLTRPYY